jgi:hypothetical protein
MDDMKGAHIISGLRKRWIMHSFLSAILISIGIAILFYFITHKLFNLSAGWSVTAFIAALFILLFVRKSWQTSNSGIAQLLNQKYPVLEESSGLLLKTYPELNTLEKLQYQKTEETLSGIHSPLNISKKLLFPLAIFAVFTLTGFAFFKLPFSFSTRGNSKVNTTTTQPAKPEVILPEIRDAFITIKPPVYTKKETRDQDKFNLVIEDGSSVNWKINTNAPAKKIKLIFNDLASISMQPADSAYQTWKSDKIIPSSGFYQVNINGNLSELYKIETIPDQPPVIHIQSPKQYTTIDFGEPQQVLSRIDMNDDYGINNASITATIASGSGEAVKFKEHKIEIPGFSAGRTQYQLQKLLSLPQLGMQPGDELYFYVRAIDNNKQETRSDIYIIHLPDTAQLMSLEGLANGINLKPEYFRSQRQIIIETEQLLKDKDTISAESFKNRSNNLGIDQKLLRLRYGKFLGEEDESGLFEGEVSDKLSDPSNFSNADAIRDAFTDKHDNAEDATFLEPAVKEQLKATLTEMWNAELRLRTFKPQEALPYEYKALRLLKELQQKSRVYVAKTNLKTTPLDLQKRLTGDLSKIGTPLQQRNIELQSDPLQVAREALGTLEQLKLADNSKDISQETLRKATLLLNESAIKQPSLYLSSVQAMRKIIDNINSGNSIRKTDIIVAENGLQRILSAPALQPAADDNSGDLQLSKQYFQNLQKKQP